MCYSNCYFEDRLGWCRITNEEEKKIEKKLGFRLPCPEAGETIEERQKIIDKVNQIRMVTK